MAMAPSSDGAFWVHCSWDATDGHGLCKQWPCLCAQVGAINAAMSSLVKCLNVFPKERLIVQRERSKSSYGVAPYFFSKLAAESPIGAAFPLLFASIVYPASACTPSSPGALLRKASLLTCGVMYA